MSALTAAHNSAVKDVELEQSKSLLTGVSADKSDKTAQKKAPASKEPPHSKDTMKSYGEDNWCEYSMDEKAFVKGIF